MKPNCPIYIPSKSRADSRLTMKMLDGYGVEYFVVVEEQEFDQYAAVIPERRLLVLDMRYKDEYETYDTLGDEKSKGAGPARNFAWDHSVENGHEWHWVMDDNIRDMQRLHKNTRIKFGDATGFRIMEDFALRFKNVAIAGPQYKMFAPDAAKFPAFVANTRIYSCTLIRNDIPFRWAGRYNEDTLLSLRALKAGWCTIQFNAVLQNKAPTQTIGGGNTEEFYDKEGTLEKSKMLVRLHPDVARLMWRFGRAHHWVDYRPFRKNKLVYRDDYDPEAESVDYGLSVKRIESEKR